MLRVAGKKTASVLNILNYVRVLFILFSLLLFLFGFINLKNIDCSDLNVIIGDNNLCLKVSDDNEERLLGLSGTKKLAPNEGMLFVFDLPGFHGIWMKDMNYSIDIVWLDVNKNVVHVEKNISPQSYPKVYAPNTLATYVVELTAGTSSSLNINKGDKLYW